MDKEYNATVRYIILFGVDDSFTAQYSDCEVSYTTKYLFHWFDGALIVFSIESTDV